MYVLFYLQQNTVFGAPLLSMLTDDNKIPIVVEKLITAIEINGLYTEGIYRKPGSAAKIKQLIKDVNSGKCNKIIRIYPHI